MNASRTLQTNKGSNYHRLSAVKASMNQPIYVISSTIVPHAVYDVLIHKLVFIKP